MFEVGPCGRGPGCCQPVGQRFIPKSGCLLPPKAGPESPRVTARTHMLASLWRPLPASSCPSAPSLLSLIPASIRGKGPHHAEPSLKYPACAQCITRCFRNFLGSYLSLLHPETQDQFMRQGWVTKLYCPYLSLLPLPLHV